MTFDEWIMNVFDHPVRQPHWEGSPTYWDGHAATIVGYMTRLFAEADTVLDPFSDAQAAQGLWALISQDITDYPLLLTERDASVSLRVRLDCIEAMESLFQDYFARRCSPHLSHLDTETPAHVSPLNGVCYMWWDILPLNACMGFHRPEDPNAAHLGQAILTVLQRIVKIDAIACQESALFGLAQSVHCYPEADESINNFVDSHPDLWKRFNPIIRARVFGRE